MSFPSKFSQSVEIELKISLKLSMFGLFAGLQFIEKYAFKMLNMGGNLRNFVEAGNWPILACGGILKK